jgi:hypothetical protein
MDSVIQVYNSDTVKLHRLKSRVQPMAQVRCFAQQLHLAPDGSFSDSGCRFV